jgi:multidrug efflux pump subunit AcrB
MINEIDPLKSAITSIVSATFGTFTNYCAAFGPIGFISLQAANTFFQHLAWTVAILAGIVSIINGCRQWHLKKRQKQ